MSPFTAAPPPAVKPKPDTPRAGKGWRLTIADQYTEPGLIANGGGSTVTTPLHKGLVAACWVGHRGKLTCLRETWDEVCHNSMWADALDELKREAVDNMPRAVMRDLGIDAMRRGHATVQPGHSVPTAEVGITALNSELRRLVADMAAYTSPPPEVQADFARRYGRYRETMTKLREQFTAAEGAFDTAQAMLIRFMGDDG